MAYSDFSLEDLEAQFGVSNQLGRLFPTLPPLEPSDYLKTALDLAAELPVHSEKAKSEAIVFPLLVELRNRNDKFFTIYSGDNLKADKERGLQGECDFILAKDVHSFSINYPILQLVEAKRSDVTAGVAQCAAQMLGAKIFNEKKGATLEQLYGCVTSGDEWLFLKLEGHLTVDVRKYYLIEIGQLLAVFQYIIDYYKSIL